MNKWRDYLVSVLSLSAIPLIIVACDQWEKWESGKGRPLLPWEWQALDFSGPTFIVRKARERGPRWAWIETFYLVSHNLDQCIKRQPERTDCYADYAAKLDRLSSGLAHATDGSTHRRDAGRR